METIVLVMAEHVGPADPLDSLRGFARAYLVDRVLTVEDNVDSCYIVEVKDEVEDGVFDGWPTELLPSGVCSIFSLDYRSPALATAVVHSLSRNYIITVDTNYGHIIPSSTLTARMLSRDNDAID